MRLPSSSRRSLWLTIALVLTAPAPLMAQRVIAGFVVDAETARPIEGAQVGVDGASSGATTTADGRFRLPNVSGDRVTLRIMRLGYRAATQQANAGSENVRIALTRSNVTLGAVEVVARRKYAAEVAATSTRMDAPLIDIPQSVQVITSDYLEDQSAVTFSDVFRNVSGVTAFSPYEDYTIRGFRTSESMRNGTRSTTSHFFAPPRMTNVERVEVLKGPSAILTGSFEPGGVINVVTKKPTAETERRLSLTAGNFGRFNTELDLGGAVNQERNLLYRVSASLQRDDNFRPYDEARNWTIAPSISWSPVSGITLGASAEVMRDRQGYNRGIVAPDGDVNAVPITWTRNEPGDTVGNKSQAYEATLDQILPRGWRLQAVARYTFNDVTSWVHDQGPFETINGERFVNRIFYDYPWADRYRNGSITLSGAARTGGIAHNLVVGTDRTDNTSVTDGRTAYEGVPPMSLENPRYGQIDRDQYIFTKTNSNFDNRFTAAFLQDLITLHPKLKLMAGVRFDDFRVRSKYEEISIAGDTGYYADTAATGSYVTLRGGAVFQPTPATSLYASYSESVNPGNLASTGREGGPFDPEESWQVELGAKRNWFGDRLTSTLSLYQIKKQNVIVPVPDVANRYRNGGEVESRGAEVDVTGAITPLWSLTANYAWNHVKTTKDTETSNIGKTFPNAPRNRAAIWTRYDVPRLHLGFGAGSNYVSRRTTYSDNTHTPAYAVWDAALFHQWQRFETSLKVNNLFDRKYFMGGYSENAIFPGWPRTVMVTVRTRL